MLEPLSSTVDAGSSVSVALRVRNTGDIVEEYHVDVVGDPALWCVIEPSTVRLYPGTTASVQLTFTPPRNSDSTAGPHPFGVRVTPVETPDAVMVPEGNVTVTPFVDVRAEMLPVTVRGWRRAKPRLVVDNYGNTTATAAVLADGQGNRLDFDIRNPAIQIPPGRANFSLLRLRPDRTLWLGQKINHSYTTTLQLSGAEPVAASGTFVQTALLPRWVARLFAVLAALLCVFAGLWFAIHPSVSTATTTDSTPAASTTISAPATSAAPSASLTPSTSAPPSSAPAKATTQAAGAPAPNTSTSASSAPPAITLPAAVAYWKLNDASGSTASDDAEGDNNPGTLSNVGWCTSNCAEFGGNAGDSSVTSAHTALDTSPTGSFTVSVGVDLYSGYTGKYETMVSQDGSTSSGFYLQVLPTGYWAFSRPGTQCASTSPAVTGHWTTVTGVYDASTSSLSIYVNGQEQRTCPLTSGDPAQATSGDVVIGRAFSNGTDADWCSAFLDDVVLFNSALTPQQMPLMQATYY